jgi:protein-glutamine gamma-glutamyltransferase
VSSVATFSKTLTWSGMTAALSRREREVRDTLWLLGTVVFAVIPLIVVLPIWVSAGFLTLVAFRCRITWLGKRLPPRWLLIALLLVAGGAIYLQYHTVVGKDAGVAYIVLLLGLKLMELRAKRDIFVVVFLSLFVILTSLFDAQTILNALWMMVDMVLLTVALMRANFGANDPPLRVKLRLAVQMTLLAMPLMVVLFVLFPRVSGPLWGLPADAFTNLTGLSESMSPGSFDKLVQSDEIAFEVKFSGRLPAPNRRYWRGPVLGFFDGRVWRPGVLGRDAGIPLTVTGATASSVSYTETLEPSNRPWLFLLDSPAAAPLVPGQTVSIKPDLQVVVDNPIRERTRFDARSYTDFQYGKDEPASRLAELRMLPRNSNPQTIAYASQMRQRYPNPREMVGAILAEIHDQPFYYTLTPPLYPGRNSVDEFFFGDRRGYCEHYAGAMTVILRAAGIPARVVTGYLGGEVNPVNGYLALRQRDAHAWAEYWDKDTGWTRVDPTAAIAPERVEQGLQPQPDPIQAASGEFITSNVGFIRYLRQHADALTNAWDQFVVGYSGDDQEGLLSRFGIPQLDWQSLTIGLVVIFALVLAVIAGQAILKREKPAPIVRLYQRLCREAARTGVIRLPNEGPRDYAERVAAGLTGDLRVRILDAFTYYQKLRYGDGSENDSASLADLKRRIKSISRASFNS